MTEMTLMRPLNRSQGTILFWYKSIPLRLPISCH